MRYGRLVGAAETSKELAEWRGFEWKNLNKLGLLNKKEWPQCHKVSSWQGHQSCLCEKEKNRSISPDRQIMTRERVKVKGGGPHFGKRGKGSEREHGEERTSSALTENGLQEGGKAGQAKRTSLGEVGERMNR